MSTSAWGDPVTRYFFDLGPERVLEAVESAGFRCTGRCHALNSYENRVYEVEIELSAAEAAADLYATRKVVKFYRPGRWNREQILEEHEFLRDLIAAEVPVVAPLPFRDGSTLNFTPKGELYFAIWPKVGGRAPDEFDGDKLRWIGRLLGRLHNAGAAREAPHRIVLGPASYGIANLEYLLSQGWLPPEFRDPYEKAVREICRISEPAFREFAVQRIHGDCHNGNLLWNASGPFFLDFDDMLRGPVVQDFWLLAGGRDEAGRAQLEEMLEAYEEMRGFDRRQLRLIEALRALRYIHFTAWVARRWKDPAFGPAFPNFNTPQYWNEQTHDLQEQLLLIQDDVTGL